jgi:hypothetical protein
MRASVRGREELAARVQQALALTTKKEAEMIVDTVVAALEAHSAEQSGNERVHAEAGQLRQVLSPAQGRDSQKDSIHGQDHPHEGSKDDQVRQSGDTSPTGTG